MLEDNVKSPWLTDILDVLAGHVGKGDVIGDMVTKNQHKTEPDHNCLVTENVPDINTQECREKCFNVHGYLKVPKYILKRTGAIEVIQDNSIVKDVGYTAEKSKQQVQTNLDSVEKCQNKCYLDPPVNNQDKVKTNQSTNVIGKYGENHVEGSTEEENVLTSEKSFVTKESPIQTDTDTEVSNNVTETVSVISDTPVNEQKQSKPTYAKTQSSKNTANKSLSTDDQKAIKKIEDDLKYGSLAGCTRWMLGAESVCVPRIVQTQQEMMLLQQVASKHELVQLSLDDIDEMFSCDDCGQYSTDNIVQQVPMVELPAVAAQRENECMTLLQETENAMYRHIHGLEPCCQLDSTSCVLSSMVAMDHLRRDNQHNTLPSYLNQNDIDCQHV